MKIIRSTKCSLKFTTNNKISQLETVLSEYGKVVNTFINYFWNNNSKSWLESFCHSSILKLSYNPDDAWSYSWNRMI